MSTDQRKRNRAWIEEYKVKHPCVRCGEAHPCVLEFHHRDEATKRATISSLVNGGAGIDKIKRELALCDVLCSNCHKKLHWDAERN